MYIFFYSVLQPLVLQPLLLLIFHYSFDFFPVSRLHTQFFLHFFSQLLSSQSFSRCCSFNSPYTLFFYSFLSLFIFPTVFRQYNTLFLLFFFITESLPPLVFLLFYLLSNFETLNIPFLTFLHPLFFYTYFPVSRV